MLPKEIDMDFNELTEVYQKEQAALTATIKNFPWKNRNAYAAWLANSYEYALNSTRILALAGGLMPLHLTRFSNRFITHAAEEKGHEKLLENDLKALNFSLSDVPVTDEMKLFHQSLYYWLSSMGTPLGIFGFVLALEGIAVLNGEYIHKETHAQYGDKGTKFVKVHSVEDPDHLEKAFSAVKSLSPQEITVVANSMIQYCRQYNKVLIAIQNNNAAIKAA